MKKIIILAAALSLAFLFSGCSSLAKMKTTKRMDAANKNEALINFVRPGVFMGDGVKFEVWDGETFVGTLAAGTMIQYAATPGKHTFMVDPTQGGRWAYLNIETVAGKVYYIKPNIIPLVGLRLGAAEASDPRISDWNDSLTPKTIDTSKTSPLPKKAIDKAQKNLNAYQSAP
ncbi:MAG TPA: hypothetical protein VN030_13200 [Cellvibrio sp.]|nr:hypothetical protein [Cellvibrio sp.]